MEDSHSPFLTQVSHRAMACEFAVLLPPWQANRTDAVLDALETLDETESRLTVYRESSEVSRVNTHASHGPQRVSESTFALLQRAQYWSDWTGGAFDVTAGPLVRIWGFLERAGQKPTDSEIRETLRRVGHHKLQLIPEHLSVRFVEPGMEINLGAIGKGYAIDDLCDRLLREGLTDFLIHGGRSSVRAVGSSDEQRLGWRVGIAHPTKPNRRLAGVWLKDQALATSGSGNQFFHHRGKRYGHVIDPRTGYPAGDLLSLTVLAPSATDCDALATGLYVMGAKDAEKTNRWNAHRSPEMPHRDARPDIGEPETPEKRAAEEMEYLYPMLMVHPGKRQDEVTMSKLGNFPLDDGTDE